MLQISIVTIWYADIVNYLITRTVPEKLALARKAKIKSDAKYYMWDEPYLWKHSSDHVIEMCLSQAEFTFSFLLFSYFSL